MFEGRIVTTKGETINFSGEDITETYLEMFIALEDKKLERLIIQNVRR